MSWHNEKVKVTDEFGETEEVFRFTRRCDRCCHYAPKSKLRGQCHLLNRSTSARYTKCDHNEPTDFGLIDMWLETEARNGDQIGVIYKGRKLYLDRAAFIAALGFDPDE